MAMTALMKVSLKGAEIFATLMALMALVNCGSSPQLSSSHTPRAQPSALPRYELTLPGGEEGVSVGWGGRIRECVGKGRRKRGAAFAAV